MPKLDPSKGGGEGQMEDENVVEEVKENATGDIEEDEHPGECGKVEEIGNAGCEMENEDNFGGGEVEDRRDKKRQEAYRQYENKIRKERMKKKLPRHDKFGQPCPLTCDKVPTKRDLICAILHTQSFMRLEQNLKQNECCGREVGG